MCVVNCVGVVDGVYGMDGVGVVHAVFCFLLDLGEARYLLPVNKTVVSVVIVFLYRYLLPMNKTVVSVVIVFFYWYLLPVNKTVVSVVTVFFTVTYCQ